MDGKKLRFSDYEQSTTKKRTKKAKFLIEMDQIVPWRILMPFALRWALTASMI